VLKWESYGNGKWVGLKRIFRRQSEIGVRVDVQTEDENEKTGKIVTETVAPSQEEESTKL